MKIKFYQLPKTERQQILDAIEKLVKDRGKAQQDFYSAQNRLDTAKFNLDANNHCLQLLKDKYDFE